MKFIALYKDPKKKRLQQIELAFLALAAPVALVWGAKTRGEWATFRQAEQHFQQGDECLHRQQPEEAVKEFEQCVALRPDFYGAWEAMGATQHLMGRHDLELETYKRAVAAIPDRGELHRELGTVYHESGDHQAELASLTRARDILGPEEIFTFRLLDRAQREADGTYPAVATAARPEAPIPQAAATPDILDPRAQNGHSHAGHDHDHGEPGHPPHD